MKLQLLLTISVLLTSAFNTSYARAPKLKHKKEMNFKIRPEKIRSSSIYYHLSTLTPSKFKASEMSDIDTTNLADQADTEVLYLKSIFKVPHHISHYDNAFFANMDGLRRIYGAKEVNRLGDSRYGITISKIGIQIKFNLDVNTFGDLTTISDKYKDFASIVNKYDEDSTDQAIYQVMHQYDFTRIFGETITLNKLIPHGDETIVVSYSIGRAKLSAIEEIDQIPFVSGRGVIKSELKKSISNTHKEMSR